MRSLLVVFLLLISCHLFGQDTLKTNKGDLVVKVIEVGLDEIKYHVWNLDQSPVIVIEKRDVKEIVFSNGQRMIIESDRMRIENIHHAAMDKNSVLKIEFLGPLNNDLTIGYERVIRPGFNLEGKIGIIGIGVDENNENASGAFLKFGPKLWSGKDYYVRGMRMSHPLRGTYIRPEFIFSRFDIDRTIYSFLNPDPITKRYSYTNFALNICFGKQVLFSNVISIDWYLGIGYGLQLSDAPEADTVYLGWEDASFIPYAYSHLFMGRNFPMTLSGGLTVGVILK